MGELALKRLSKKWTQHYAAVLSDPFWRFSSRVLQSARVNAVRCAMVCDAYFPFPKVLYL